MAKEVFVKRNKQWVKILKSVLDYNRRRAKERRQAEAK